jgi:hypothetical protein
MYRARISSLLGKITILLVICCCCLPARAKYGGGSGTPNDPYLIYTAEQMNTIGADSNDWDKHFKLMADIDLSAFTGTSFNIIGERYYDGGWVTKPFKGSFDGNGHTISNFTYKSMGRHYVGLFGYVDWRGEIKDLGLTGPDIDVGRGDEVGSLVGSLVGTVTNCYVEGGIVSGDENVGGLVGINRGTISKCYSEIVVKGLYSGTGGLVGNSSGTITNCYSTGSVSGTLNVGGLVGENRGTITYCYSTSSVSGSSYVGGLVGTGSNIANCYATGSVTGPWDVGGLVGRSTGLVTNSFWDIQTSGQLSSAGGKGKTTAELKMANTFLGWWCEPVWTIDESVDYPRLLWENKPGELIIAPSDLYEGGSGEPNDPYLIYTTEQLNTIGLVTCDWDKCFKLIADLDLGQFTGEEFNIIGYYRSSTDNKPFTGVFDGNGHTISNFSYTSTDKRYIGLFGYIDDPNAKVRNLGLTDPNVDMGTEDRVGSLVGYVKNGTITNCYAEGGSVSGDGCVGGLVGSNGGTITNCYVEVDVWADYDVGGLVGRNEGIIRDCCSTSSISGGSGVGGLVGSNSNGIIINCYSTGNVLGTRWGVGGLSGSNGGTITNCCSLANVSSPGSEGYDIGGLVGSNGDTIFNCYSAGSASSENPLIGGLAGSNDGTISNCYATTNVSGFDRVGGIVGFNLGTVTKCYSTGIISGTMDVGGLVGFNSGDVSASFWDTESSGQMESDGGLGKTTAEMKEMGTFCDAGWDFMGEADGPSDIWAEPTGGGYPMLWWQLPSLPELPTFSGGMGEPDDPYLLSTAEDLKRIGHNPRLMKAHFELKNDIDLSGITLFIIGDPACPYDGIFDGNGHRILNFSYNSTSTNAIGLFAAIHGETAGIKNLGLINAEIDAGTGNYIGLLVGINYGTITNCYVDGGSVMGNDYLGGLVGANYFGTITSSYSTASVSGGYSVGGLVGGGYDIADCYATGDVTGDYKVGGLVGSGGGIANCYANGSVSGVEEVGGLVGEGGIISNCYASGTVSGISKVGGLVGIHGNAAVFSTIINSYSIGRVSGLVNVGGLIGCNNGSVWNCNSNGYVSGDSQVGGLVGINHFKITNCYSTGGILGNEKVGGLVGWNPYGEVTASFWDIETSGQATSDGGTGLTTDQMQTMSTFTDAGWDFVGESVNGTEDIWWIPQQDYPHLWWEGMHVPMKLTPVSLNCRSEGNWVKAHLTLPQGFTVADVDLDRPAVLLSFGFESAPLYVFVNKEKLVEIEAAFEREQVCSLTGEWPDELIVAGFLADGNIFLGTSPVRIIHPGMKVIEDLANYWLNADCVHPTWCDRIDMNRDSLVNLADYALLMNINVEFLTDE